MPGASKVAAEADGLGKLGGSIDGDAVQRLAPPVVGGHVEAGNGARLVDELRGLLFKSHSVDQVGGALLGRKGRIQVSGLLRILRGRPVGCGT